MRTFPIFVSFDGKAPLVVGGGKLAAVKTRLLLKRADLVDVSAEDLVPATVGSRLTVDASGTTSLKIRVVP